MNEILNPESSNSDATSTELAQARRMMAHLEKALEESRAEEVRLLTIIETCRIFGFPEPPPSLHYHEFLARVHPDDRAGMDRGLHESFDTFGSRPLEYRFILPDGVIKDIKTVSEPVRDLTGAVKLMDVTEQKEAGESLRASEILARWQLNSLTRTLEFLSAEPDSDKLLEHVLRTITEQLDAHSCGVWRRVDSTGEMAFECAFEGGRLVTDSRVKVEAIDSEQPLPGACMPTRAAAAGQPTLVEDLREHPVSPWRDYLLEQGVVTILFLPTGIAGRVEGVLSIRFARKRVFCSGEMELAQALATQTMLAMQLKRLVEQNRQATVTAERNRMARDIHDTLAQGFTGVIMQLEAAQGAAARSGLGEAAKHIDRASTLARSSLEEVRRSVRALRPRSLRDGNLCMAMADLLQKMSDGLPLTATFHLEGEQRMMPEDWEEGLLRIAQESLTNTIKHAQAKNFRATLIFAANQIQLKITDDGSGFDPDAEHDGFGLVGIKERVDQMSGEFIITSQPAGGTQIRILLNDSASAADDSEYAAS